LDLEQVGYESRTYIDKPQGKVTLNSEAEFWSDLFLVNGILDINGNDVTLEKIFTVQEGGTLVIQGSEVFNKPPFFEANALVVYKGNGDEVAVHMHFMTGTTRIWKYILPTQRTLLLRVAAAVSKQ